MLSSRSRLSNRGFSYERLLREKADVGRKPSNNRYADRAEIGNARSCYGYDNPWSLAVAWSGSMPFSFGLGHLLAFRNIIDPTIPKSHNPVMRTSQPAQKYWQLS
jgi:hypothetical protein